MGNLPILDVLRTIINNDIFWDMNPNYYSIHAMCFLLAERWCDPRCSVANGAPE
jgi:hypothetical protein